MRRVFEAADSAEAGLVRGLLEDAAIPCAVRQEQVSGAFPTPAFGPEVWIERDEDYDRALAIVSTWEGPSAGENRAARAWACPRCGEACEAAFDSCWKCGAERATEFSG